MISSGKRGENKMVDWPNTERRGYVADMGSAVGLMNADIQIDNLRRLLARCLKSVEGSKWRDRTGLSAEAHPVWDDVRETLNASR